MASYLILNIIFLLLVVVLLRFPLRRPSRRWAFGLVTLLFMTAVFDSLIIAYSIVGYDTDKIIGLYIGRAPVEDFFYAITAMLIVPLIWNRLEGNHAKRH